MTNIIEETIRKAFRDMDPITGHFPSWPCQGCGKELDGENGRNPAETYAGTFNGLCYACTAAAPFVVSIAELDGARDVSWPPHCPAWRRDREDFYAYEDCEICDGMGATRAYRTRSIVSGGGPFWERCPSCGPRYWNHPRRRWLQAREDLLARAAQARFTHLLDQAALAELGVKRASRKRLNEAAQALPEEHVAAIRTLVMARYVAIKVRLNVHRDRIYATRSPA